MTSVDLEQQRPPRAVAATQDLFRRMLSHAVLAPSGHNTQPWLFRLDEDHLDLIADRRRALPVVDPCDRELTISCGAALGHLVTAGRHYGKLVTIETDPDSSAADVLARCRIGADLAPEADDEALFEAMTQRHTSRAAFDDRELPADVCRRCVEAARRLGVELVLISDRARRSEIADLVAEGDRMQFADPDFRKELAAWIHSRRAPGHDGMSGQGFGMPDILSPLGALAIRAIDMGKAVADGDRQKIVEGSPLLAVFSTSEDTPAAWLATGQALSAGLITLAAAGATASYLNPPVELETLRPRLQALAECRDKPQLLMRFGYGSTSASSVRRGVDEVLIP